VIRYCIQRRAAGLIAGAASLIIAIEACALAQAPGEAMTQGTVSGASKTVATVDGTLISRADVDRALEAAVRDQKVDPAVMPKLQASLLEQLINTAVLRKFLADQKVSPSKDEIDAALTRLRAVLKEQKSSLTEYLTKAHQTEDQLRETISQELALRKFVSQQGSDDNLRVMFKQFHEQFDGTQRRVSHILLRPDGPADQAKLKALAERAEKLRGEINSGSITFEKAADKYSAGPSRRNGGDIGFIPISGVMTPEFSSAAFAIKQGEISPPVSSPFGVHLIKVTDIKAGTKTFSDAREAVQAAFADFLLKKVMTEERGKAKVEYTPGFPHFKPGTTQLDETPVASASK
jgi:parvulin-like peptidyl-prolyl isomerase